ncbi:PaaI family thioesterase [Siminovitchia terrae]|uniref:PaaI family thioesterase n=1 Tax=Siminovitchia terrae TaxID=1914933 RepID=UPI0028AD4F8D|nr:PaaI family thioesterase [Siminovitchia terrae]
MAKIYTMSDLQRVVMEAETPPPCDLTMQIKVNRAENGISQGVWKVDSKYINGSGIVMGGFLSAAADIMMAYAISSLLTNENGFASIDLDTTFHRPAVEGVIEIKAEVERLGRTIAYVTAELVQNDKKVASCVSSVLIHQKSILLPKEDAENEKSR